MITTRGKKNYYLGMDLDLANKGKAKVITVKYLKGVIE